MLTTVFTVNCLWNQNSSGEVWVHSQFLITFCRVDKVIYFELDLVMTLCITGTDRNSGVCGSIPTFPLEG